jgi:hypothetical protein
MSVTPHFLLTSRSSTTHSIWRDVVSRDSNHVVIRVVLRLVKCETRLAREHRHIFLLRRKRPGKLLTPVCIEMHFDAFCAFDGYEALCLESSSANNGRTRKSSCRTEHAVQRYGSVRCTDSKDYLRIPNSRYDAEQSGYLLLLRYT